MYNLLFTSFPPVAIGLLDQYCTAKTRMAYPSLYRSSQEGAFFNNRIFWMWMGNAILHSIILYWLPMTGYFEGIAWESGKSGDYLAIGNIVYTAVVITVCCKAGLEMESWSLLTHLSIWGSILFWLLFLVAYSFVWPIGLPIAPDMAGMCNLVYSTGLFWLGVILFTCTALIPDIAFKVVRNTVYTSGQVAQNAPGASVAEQTKDIVATLDRLLAEAGTDKSNLLSATIWLSDIGTFDEMNAVWDAWVAPGHTPCRACVESRLAKPQFTVEIGVVAALP